MDDTDSQNSNDGHQGAPPQGDARQAHMDRERVAYLEQQMQYLVNQVQNLQALPPPHAMPPPNLNLPQPPLFSGTQSELPLFKLKLLHFLVGNQTTYHNSETQLLYASSLLSGSAGQWYHSLLDPVTLLLPTTYDLPRFFTELEDFFGGGGYSPISGKVLANPASNRVCVRPRNSISEYHKHIYSPVGRPPPHLCVFSEIA